MAKAEFNWPKTLDHEVWEAYLERRLSHGEVFLFESYRTEKKLNQTVQNLAVISEKKGLYIPELTKLHGNCLFESLVTYGIAKSVEDLRKGLAYFMYMFQDYPNFFPTNTQTIKQIFEVTNEIPYVYCAQDKKVYKYTYNVMCQDLAQSTSWGKLPTELLMLVTSIIIQSEFIVVSSHQEWEHNVNAYRDMPADKIPALKKIYLGHLGEYHYIPLKTRVGDEKEQTIPKYVESKNEFWQWADAMQQKVAKKRQRYSRYNNGRHNKYKNHYNNHDNYDNHNNHDNVDVSGWQDNHETNNQHISRHSKQNPPSYGESTNPYEVLKEDGEKEKEKEGEKDYMNLHIASQQESLPDSDIQGLIDVDSESHDSNSSNKHAFEENIVHI